MPKQIKSLPLIKDCQNLSVFAYGKEDWLWVVVTGCGFDYFVPFGFVLFWVVRSLNTPERLKYLLFTALKIHTMAYIVKKQNSFIFGLPVT